jgi:exodeoxyribonuclease III
MTGTSPAMTLEVRVPRHRLHVMSLKITTWNINSVRLRIDLVAGFLRSAQPDVLCLQETKCPDEAFPLKRFKRLGYEHAAISGQKGYHGVAVLSRVPFEKVDVHNFCGKADCRHISVVLGERAELNDPITLHNFYVPAGGDEPDAAANPKFRHKLDFLDEMRVYAGLRPEKAQRAILVGDLNVAPLEHDVWSHKQMIKVVSHTPMECEKLVAAQKSGGWIDSMRVLTPEPEKLYTWWSYRAMDNWRASDRGRRLDHVWTSDALADRVSAIKIGKNYRGAKRPSDHVPVTATIEL